MYRTTQLFRTILLKGVLLAAVQIAASSTGLADETRAVEPPAGSAPAQSSDFGRRAQTCEQDRVFLVSSRHLTNNLCAANLENPGLKIWQCDPTGFREIAMNEYEAMLDPCRPNVIYLHGNRMESNHLMERFSIVRRSVSSYRRNGPIDWIIFSWPSQKVDFGLDDFRIKASRCDIHGLYLAWLMRKNALASIPMSVIGYSFGARVGTGALHALAGGRLGGRSLPGPAVKGAGVRVGLIAPAVESRWLGIGGYHRLAAHNMDRLALLYNRRDAVLKRYWLLEKSPRQIALGTVGPRFFARRNDGSALPVIARDYSSLVKICHSEAAYYKKESGAGAVIARLIDGIPRVLNK